MLKNISSIIKSYSVELLLLLTLLPLLFLHLPLALDWGDDFAGYLLQALNHRNNTSNASIENYLYNKDYFIYAPERYPPLYSYSLYLYGKITKPGVSNYLFLNSLILVLWSFAIYVFVKNKNRFSAFIAAILVAYFPFILELKNELLSDFLFCLLALTSILFHINNGKARNPPFYFISGFIACLAFLTKSLGVFLPISLLTIALINSYKPKHILSYFSGYAICIICGLLLFEWKEFQNLIFFSRIAQNISIIDVVKDNLNIYTVLIKYYPQNFSTYFLIEWIYIILFAMGLLGTVSSLKKIKQPIYIYFWVLFSFIIIFPNSKQGLRYLLPLLPFLVLLIFDGFRLAFLNSPNLKTAFKIIVPVLLITLLYKPTIALTSIDKINDSTILSNHPTSKALFDFLRTEVKEDETICFKKARAIVLYTNKKCFANNIEYKIEETELEMKKFNPTYFVTGNLDVLYNPALENYIKQNKSKLDTVFSNKNYNVLKWKNR
jgi:hypothetical protein